MSDAGRFLRFAALELIRREGVRVLKSPSEHDVQEWMPGWEDWDEVLVADGPGVRPSIFSFRARSSDDEGTIRELFDGLAARVASNRTTRLPSGLTIRTVAVVCLESVDPALARRLARSAPSRYFAHVKPELWIVDMASGKLYAPRSFGVVKSRAAVGVQEALDESRTSGHEIGPGDLAHAQSQIRSERESFITTLRGNYPYVTYAVLAACWLIFVLEYIHQYGSVTASNFGTIPSSKTSLLFGAMEPSLATNHGQWWRLFTEMFVHFGFLHIFMNSIALYSVGSLVERIYGSVRYAVIYAASGLFASLASLVYLVLSGQSNTLSGGASGAIFGIAGVLIVLGVRRQSIVPRAVALQLSVSMGALIVLNLVWDTFVPGIDYRAHVGGLVVGLILGYFMMPRTTDSQPNGRAAHPAGTA